MRDLLTDRVFVAPVVVQCLVVAGFFVYIGGSSIVLQTQLGISPAPYTLVFASNALVMVLGQRRLPAAGASARARPCCAVAARGWPPPPARRAVPGLPARPGPRPAAAPGVAPLAVMLGGLGLFLPASTAIVQAAGRRSAGTAAALGGGVPFFVGALTTPLTGLLGSQTVLTMASGTFAFYVLALLAAWRFRHLTLDDRPVRDVTLIKPELVGHP